MANPGFSPQGLKSYHLAGLDPKAGLIDVHDLSHEDATKKMKDKNFLVEAYNLL